MNPEEQLRSLKNDDRWMNIRVPRAAETGIRTPSTRRPLVPIIAAFAIAGTTVLALYLGLNSFRDTTAPAHRASGVPTIACPRTAEAVKANSLPRAGNAILPFSPDSAVLCRYGGLNSGQSSQLSESASVTDTSTLAQLTAAVNASTHDRYGNQSYNCPTDFNTHTNLYLHDSGSGTWHEISISTSGCQTMSNGTITDAKVTQNLAALLQRLAGKSRH